MRPAGASTVWRTVCAGLQENSTAIDSQWQQLCACSGDSGFDALARIRVNHERDTTPTPSAADFSGKRTLTARGGNHLVDKGRRNRPEIAAAEVPFFSHQAAHFVPLASLERSTHGSRDNRNFFQVLRNAPVAIDVPLEHFPVVDAVLPGFSGVAQDQTALEFVEIAAQGFPPLAARGEHNRGCAAKRWRV